MNGYVSKNAIRPEIEEPNIIHDEFFARDKEFAYYIWRLEKDLCETLERIAKKPARSNKNGFYDISKIAEIISFLCQKESPFRIVRASNNVFIFGQKDLYPGQDVLLVSSHADIVPEIWHPNASKDTDAHYFRGTFDNLGTNAACVSLMASEAVRLPDNVYFAFTAEEESGRMAGARDAYKIIKKETGIDPTVIVVDVTYEGFSNNRLFTLEGLSAPSEKARRNFLLSVCETEGEEQTFEVIRLNKKDDNSFLPGPYNAKPTSAPDESWYYDEKDCLSFSMDLPVAGSMHSDKGLLVKKPVFHGYVVSLFQMIYSLCNVSNPDMIDLRSKLTGAKDYYVKLARRR